jgi:uncharacterized membrane protein HdeD (DUF308 family)
MFTDFKGVLYFEGVLFFLLGIAAIVLPQFFTLGIEILVGGLFIVAGTVQLIRLFQGDRQVGFWSAAVSAILSLTIGALLLFYPLAGIFSLTFLLIVYFIVDGLSKLYYSYQLKPQENWGWVLLSGILSLGLAAIILAGLPQTAGWVIGLLVGINMLFFGFSLFGIASAIPKRIR